MSKQIRIVISGVMLVLCSLIAIISLILGNGESTAWVIAAAGWASGLVFESK